MISSTIRLFMSTFVLLQWSHEVYGKCSQWHSTEVEYRKKFYQHVGEDCSVVSGVKSVGLWVCVGVIDLIDTRICTLHYVHALLLSLLFIILEIIYINCCHSYYSMAPKADPLNPLLALNK